MAAKGEKQEPIICTNCNFGIIPEIDSKKMRVLFRCPECNQWNKRKHSEQMKKDGKGRKRIRLEAEEEGRSDEGKMAKLEGEGGPAADLYCAKMKKLLFNTIPFYGAKNALSIPYHFASSLKTDSSISATTAKRLAKEIATLHNSLPISAKSSIFVRACEERSDVMKVLITGPAETPYANGCFEFDVFFPSNYPNVPMQINFETTGNKTVRFNPNLYYDGKVCLSLLNTWQGSAAERWIPAKSTLLQVLVSIQALVLVEEPFYNEPGFEKMRNNSKYEIHSLLYTLRVRQLCLKWAMLHQLQNPPKAFTDVIQCHFWLKREEICAQVEEWINDYEGLVKAGKLSKADLAGNPDVNANTMKKDYEKLKAKFSAMKCPPTLEDDAMNDDGDDIDNKIVKA